MKNILITGANGFIGRNLRARLAALKKYNFFLYDINNNTDEFHSNLLKADLIFHLAGVNRPEKVEEYDTGNFLFTKLLTEFLENNNRKPVIVFSSSIQAELENAYGISKKKAEDVLIEYARRNKTKIYIFRLKNVFGKWSRPDYNSVVATFCHNIARAQEVRIQDENKIISLIYIDDIVDEFISICENPDSNSAEYFYQIKPDYEIKLGDLSAKLCAFRELIRSDFIPDFSDDFNKKLFSTFLSYFQPVDLENKLELKIDERGWLFELIKSKESGQVFVSTTKPGVTRGNHYHHTKIEKFCLIRGKALIKLRKIDETEIYSFPVDDKQIKVVNIPPGYTHSITNISTDTEMILISWANEIFDQKKPDTFFCEVEK